MYLAPTTKRPSFPRVYSSICVYVLLKASKIPISIIASFFFVFSFFPFSYEDFFALAASLAASLATLSFLAMAASTPMPPKTRLTPNSCICVRLWPKATTERIMVNILRVTVTVTSKTDENVERV